MRIAQIIFYEGKGEIDKKIRDSQFTQSIHSKGPNPEHDYDIKVLKSLKDQKNKKHII